MPAPIEPLAIQPNAYCTIDEAARLLRVSRRDVLRLLETERALGVKIGRQWRILGAALLDLPGRRGETEAEMVADWLAVSASTLQVLWDNEGDAIYDNLGQAPGHS